VTHDEIWQAVKAERTRQAEKWNREHAWGYGDCSRRSVPMLVKAAVLAEEAGEVVKAVLNAGPHSPFDPDPDVKAETIQTLAVAWAMLEAM
jgi:hypothetical protein